MLWILHVILFPPAEKAQAITGRGSSLGGTSELTGPVDGRNPAPVELGSLSQYLYNFFRVSYIPGGARCLPTTVLS